MLLLSRSSLTGRIYQILCYVCLQLQDNETFKTNSILMLNYTKRKTEEDIISKAVARSRNVIKM